MKKRITQISPVSLGKIVGVIQGGIVFVFTAFAFLAAVVATVSIEKVRFAAIIYALIGMLVITLFQAILGFFLGLVAGWIYNLSTKLTGGLELELSESNLTESKEIDESQNH